MLVWLNERRRQPVTDKLWCRAAQRRDRKEADSSLWGVLMFQSWLGRQRTAPESVFVGRPPWAAAGPLAGFGATH